MSDADPTVDRLTLRYNDLLAQRDELARRVELLAADAAEMAGFRAEHSQLLEATAELEANRDRLRSVRDQLVAARDELREWAQRLVTQLETARAERDEAVAALHDARRLIGLLEARVAELEARV